MRGGLTMPTGASYRTDVERLLVDAASLLLERLRIELEREVEASGGSPGNDTAVSLARVRELEDALKTIRQRPSAPAAVPEPVPGRQVSKFYEVPGQADG
jgi:hypothetical protein